MKFAILTPFLIPPSAVAKRANLGDGFILESIRNLIRPDELTVVLSSRQTPSPDEIQAINQCDALILGGANQLNDHFTLWPSMQPEDINRITVPIFPMGIGLDGLKHKNHRPSSQTVRLLRAIHERIPYSSWRCPRTTAYLQRHFPDLKERFLMTGCPVQYQQPIFQPGRYSQPSRCIAVTVTERDKFWTRESLTLRYVARTYPQARHLLVLHQDFRCYHIRWRWRHGLFPPAQPADLHRLAEKLGFEIHVPATVQEAFELYREVDGHFGSRLHAHLYLLGRCKASWLTQVDDRCLGFSEHTGFPLCDARDFSAASGYDFESYRERTLATWPTMKRFIQALRGEATV